MLAYTIDPVSGAFAPASVPTSAIDTYTAGNVAAAQAAATLAEEWASQATGVVGGTTYYSALYYSQLSSASATASATSATASSASATASATSATASAGSATTSAGSATASATSATASATSATLSQAWASQAAGVVNGTTWYSALYYAQQAATSASGASGSATSAAASATTAGTQATNAAASATAAAASATAAANSAASIAYPITLAHGGTGATTQAAAQTALGIGQTMARNRIINGDCRVAQYASASSAAGSFGGPDRWFMSNNGAGGAFTQSLGTLTYGGITKNCVTQTVTTANTSVTGGNYWQGITQKIEGDNIADLVGQPVAVSFIFNTNVAGTYPVSLRDSTGANSYVSTFAAAANTPVKVTVPLPAIPTGAVVPNSAAIGMYLCIGAINTGTYQAASANTWVASAAISAPGCTNWGTAVNNFISATDVQLESGTVATPFERRDIGDVQRACYRYFFNVPMGFPNPVCYGNTSAVIPFENPVMMRANPTIASNIAFANMTQGGANGASAWGMQAGGVSYTTISGSTPTLNFQVVNPQQILMLIYGGTWSNTPNYATFGTNCYITMNAEL
jgi:hypothetical protein